MSRRDTRSTKWLRAIALTPIVAMWSVAVHAQGYSFDARGVAMGGVDVNNNLAMKMIEDEQDYTSIVIPIGLIQVFKNTNIYNADSTEFDPIRAAELLMTPFPYVVGRDQPNAAQALFASDLRNATLNRRLSVYKGFVPANDLLAEGLVSPTFGHTFKFHQRPNGSFHGIYVGAGPYLSIHTNTHIDEGLTSVLATGTDRPNARFPVTEVDNTQLALAIAGGYRGRFALGSASESTRDGLYVAANVNYLRGFGYNHDDFGLTLLTDSKGLIANASTSSSGTGMRLMALASPSTSASASSSRAGKRALAPGVWATV